MTRMDNTLGWAHLHSAHEIGPRRLETRAAEAEVDMPGFQVGAQDILASCPSLKSQGDAYRLDRIGVTPPLDSVA
jgi:hypothetical protein